MRPFVWRDLAPLGQPDHVHRRRVAALAAGAAFQRGFEFPERRVARPSDRIQRQARARLAAIAFDLEPAEPAIETLRDRRRRLRRPAIPLHPDRPRFRLRTVGRADRLPGRVARGVGADVRADDAAAEMALTRPLAHDAALQRRAAARATPQGLAGRNGAATPSLRSGKR
jgi:hypothetical protein